MTRVTEWADGIPRNPLIAHASSGRPARAAYCFGPSRPKRLPLPAATIKTAKSVIWHSFAKGIARLTVSQQSACLSPSRRLSCIRITQSEKCLLSMQKEGDSPLDAAAVLEALSAAILVVDPDDVIRFANG